MSRAWLGAIAAVVGVGCSVFYDPAKAPLLPCVASQCPARANAAARCEQDACAWTCSPGFVDLNSDLATRTGSNGCEGCVEAIAPAALHALVGIPSGGIHWLWDPPDAGADSYRLCTGPQPAQLLNCTTLTAATACAQPKDGFRCSSTLTGLPNNLRHHARVQSVNGCGAASPEPAAPTRGVTPFNGALADLAGLTVESGCDGGMTLDAGVLRVTQTGFLCITALVFGDDDWDDFSLRAETRIIDSNRPFFSGVAFHYPSARRERRALVLASENTDSEVNASLTVLNPSLLFDRPAATSIGPVEGNRWLEVNLVSKGPEVAVGLGLPQDTPRQLLRWREASPSSGGNGRFALYLGTYGFATEAVEFRNVTVSTRAALPDAGSGSRKLDFAGSGLPPGVRVTPIGSNQVRMVGCPTFLAAPACSTADGGCLPNPGSRCIEVNPGFTSKHALSFDQPLGLDPLQPWRLSFKFAPTAIANNAQILRTLSGRGSVLRGPATAWNGVLSAFGIDTNASLVANTWNRFDLHFTANSYSLELNGAKVPGPTLFPPTTDWDAHLGALILGGQDGNQGSVSAFWTDIEIAQPP